MRYVKKPIPVEAVQFTGQNVGEIGRLAKGSVTPIDYEVSYGEAAQLWVHTLEGTMEVKVGDYVIRGVKDELYPCRGDIFEETYEEVDETITPEAVDARLPEPRVPAIYEEQ